MQLHLHGFAIYLCLVFVSVVAIAGVHVSSYSVLVRANALKPERKVALLEAGQKEDVRDVRR